jgi:hypothetical protein
VKQRKNNTLVIKKLNRLLAVDAEIIQAYGQIGEIKNAYIILKVLILNMAI